MTTVTIWADRENLPTIAKWWRWTAAKWLATASKDARTYDEERDAIALDLNALFQASRTGGASGLGAAVRPLVNPIKGANRVIADNLAAHVRGEQRVFRESDPSREVERAIENDAEAKRRAETKQARKGGAW